MLSDEIRKNGTIYMEIGNRKVKLLQRESVWMPFNDKSWRKKLWIVWQASYPGLAKKLYFCNRNAAIMWLKRFGKEFVTYRLNDKAVRVMNGYVWFYSEEYGLMDSAESKRTCHYATRNN